MHCHPESLQGSAAAGTALVFHTLHLPQLDAAKNDGTLAHATISRRAHAAQLNAAGRHLARRHGFQVGSCTHRSGVSAPYAPRLRALACRRRRAWLRQGQNGSIQLRLLRSVRFCSAQCSSVQSHSAEFDRSRAVGVQFLREPPKAFMLQGGPHHSAASAAWRVGSLKLVGMCCSRAVE